jgi:hypothetical protein
MDVRISGHGDNLAPGTCLPMSSICNPYGKAETRPRGIVLAGVFGSNDIRPGSFHAAQRLRIVADDNLSGIRLANVNLAEDTSC